MAHWNNTVELEPNRLDALNNLAWMLATSTDEKVRDGKKALALSQRANRVSGENPMILRTLAAAHAEIGDFAEAKDTARHAWELASSAQNFSLFNALNSDLALYERSQPVRTGSAPRP